MKKKRHELMLDYIKNNNISRQEQILKMLVEPGFPLPSLVMSSFLDLEIILANEMLPHRYEIITTSKMCHQTIITP